MTLPGPVHAVRPPAYRPGRGLPRRATPPRRRSCRSCAPSSRAWSPRAPTSSRSTSRRRPSIPTRPSDFAALFNAAVEPIVGRVRLGAHLCFGNYLGRPLARRTYRPVLDAMLGFHVDELVLEFANREMAEVEILGEIAAAGRDVAAGVIDVKNYLPRDGRRGRRADRRGPRGRRPGGAPDARPRLRLQPDRPLGDHAPSSAPWSPAATSCSADADPPTAKEDIDGRPPRSRCSAPG